MTEAELPPAFVSILRSHLLLLDRDAPLELDAELESAGLDSLSMVSLIVDLEAEFGVTLPDEFLSQETFETPGSLWNAISGLGTPRAE